MAKFFPFIVEKSTPIYIYQAIMSRSKGMNNILVASIFYLILDKGITAVRDIAKQFPESMGMGAIYEELIGKFPAFRISEKTYGIFQEMARYLKIEGNNNFVSEELNEYSNKDIMLFLLVLTLVKKEDLYTKLSLKPFITDAYIDASNQLKTFNLFSDSAPQYFFDSKEDLRGYFNFYGIATGYKEKISPVKAVLVDAVTKDTWESDTDCVHYSNKDSNTTPDEPSDGYSDEKYGEQPYSEEEYAKARAYAEEAKAKSKFEKVKRDYYEQTNEKFKEQYEQKPDFTFDPKNGAPNPDNKNDRKKVRPEPSQKETATDPRGTLPKKPEKPYILPKGWEPE